MTALTVQPCPASPGIELRLAASTDGMAAHLWCGSTLLACAYATLSDCLLTESDLDTSLWMGRTSFDIQPEHVLQVAEAFGLRVRSERVA